MILKINYNRCLSVFFLLLLAILPMRILAADAGINALFEKGNNAYARANYKGAITAYQQILKKYQSADVSYNLGNAYYKNGDLAQAILYYEKAYKLSPGDADIYHNLQFARLKTTDKIDLESTFFFARWWQMLITAMSLQALAVWSVICFLLASAALIYYLFAGSVALKKTLFFSSLAFFAVGILIIFIANRQADYFSNQQEAVVTAAPQR